MFQSVGFINAQMFWLGQHRYPLVSLQSVVSKNAVQFKGNAQHDAQEFLLWLLDRVHEDLNTVNPNIRPPIKVNYKSGFFFVHVRVHVFFCNLFVCTVFVRDVILSLFLETR